MMPIPRADLALRREVLVLFELCGVEPSAVVFSDELDLSALQVQQCRGPDPPRCNSRKRAISVGNTSCGKRLGFDPRSEKLVH